MDKRKNYREKYQFEINNEMMLDYQKIKKKL